MDISGYRIKPDQDFKLSDFDTRDKGGLDKDEAKKVLMPENIERLKDLQEKFFASDTYAFLFVIQAMDTAGKDGLIKHVMSGLNPAGTHVSAFKQPSAEEQDRDYLWRAVRQLPRRGEIGIFNRSHYEEVIVARVHNLVEQQQIPDHLVDGDIWEQRYRQIRDWERYLSENGIVTVKIFLHVSKEEQRIRLLDRIWQPDKHWKFSRADIEERQYWDQYQEAYEQMLNNTSTEYAPWYVVPADRKWFSRYLASEILLQHMEALDFDYPEVSEEGLKMLEESRDILLNEPGAPPYIPEHIRDRKNKSGDDSDAEGNLSAGGIEESREAADKAREQLETDLLSRRPGRGKGPQTEKDTQRSRPRKGGKSGKKNKKKK